jgi:hypothetical protein
LIFLFRQAAFFSEFFSKIMLIFLVTKIKAYASYQQMSAHSKNTSPAPALPEQEILQAIRGIRFGVVEIVVHDSRVTEIRQTRRVRLASGEPDKISSHPTTGG